MKSPALKYRPGTRPGSGAGAGEDDPASWEELILRHAPLIKYIAHRLSLRLPPQITTETLISAGVIGLIDALAKFNPEKKVKFKTYAEFRIRGAMLDELRSLDWVPRSVRQKAAQMERTFLNLERKRGGPVEDEEVAQEMGLSLEEYFRLLSEVKGVCLLDLESLRPPLPSLAEDNFLSLLGMDRDNDPFQIFSLGEVKKILAQSITELAPKERIVISLYYYEELTLKEIGAVMGFTESRICQIHTKAILKLRGKIKSYWTGVPEAPK